MMTSSVCQRHNSHLGPSCRTSFGKEGGRFVLESTHFICFYFFAFFFDLNFQRRENILKLFSLRSDFFFFYLFNLTIGKQYLKKQGRLVPEGVLWYSYYCAVVLFSYLIWQKTNSVAWMSLLPFILPQYSYFCIVTRCDLSDPRSFFWVFEQGTGLLKASDG